MAVSSQPMSLLRMPEVASRVGLSKSQIYRLIRLKEFPAPVRIGANSVAWPSQKIEGWITAKVEQGQCA